MLGLKPQPPKENSVPCANRCESVLVAARLRRRALQRRWPISPIACTKAVQFAEHACLKLLILRTRGAAVLRPYKIKSHRD
jgi:hypothetical protein